MNAFDELVEIKLKWLRINLTETGIETIKGENVIDPVIQFLRTLFDVNSVPDIKAAQRALSLYLLEIDPTLFKALKEYNDFFLKLLGSATYENILDRRKKFFQTTETVSVARLKTDAGTLHQFSIQLNNGTTQTINFHRKFSFGAERILTADPVSMQGDQWRMMTDRGHGLYANSLVSRIIATLGQYISEVERKYNLVPEKIDGIYQLSTASLAELEKKDVNAYRKYNTFRVMQENLRNKFHKLERAVDPTNPKAEIEFKMTLRTTLDVLRDLTNEFSKGESDKMQITSDHIIASAHKAINSFQWPNNAKGRRFQITEADQLIAKNNERITYFPEKEPSSAAGGTVFSSTGGFGAAMRDSHAYYLSVIYGASAESRKDLMAAVGNLRPSTGVGAGIASAKTRARQLEAKEIAHQVFREPEMKTGEALTFQFDKFIAVYDNPAGREYCKEHFGSFEALQNEAAKQMCLFARDEPQRAAIAAAFINKEADIQENWTKEFELHFTPVLVVSSGNQLLTYITERKLHALSAVVKLPEGATAADKTAFLTALLTAYNEGKLKPLINETIGTLKTAYPASLDKSNFENELSKVVDSLLNAKDLKRKFEGIDTVARELGAEGNERMAQHEYKKYQIIEQLASQIDPFLAKYDNELGRKHCKTLFGSFENLKKEIEKQVTQFADEYAPKETIEDFKLEEILASSFKQHHSIAKMNREYDLKVALNEGRLEFQERSEKLAEINATLKQVQLAGDLTRGNPEKVNLRETFEKHAKAMAAYCLKITNDDSDSPQKLKEFLNRMDHVTNKLYSEHTCEQFFGVTRDEFQREMLGQALIATEMTPELYQSLRLYCIEYNKPFGLLFNEADKLRATTDPNKKYAESHHTDTKIQTTPDPLISAKAAEIAQGFLDNPNVTLAKIKAAVEKRALGDSGKLLSETLYHFLIKSDEAQFNSLSKDNNSELQKMLAPYHNTAEIAELHGLLGNVKDAKNTFDNVCKTVYAEILKAEMDKLPKLQNSAIDATPEQIAEATKKAQQAARKDPRVLDAQEKVNAALSIIKPHLMLPEHEEGDVLLRNGAIGYVYRLLDPIYNVLEEMGLYDPARGALALVAMGATMAFTFIAHGATVAAASAHSKFVSALAHTYVIPAVYKNALVLTPDSSTLKVISGAMVDGVTIGKAVYLTSSAADYAQGHTGFTGNLINGIMNNPVEFGLLATFLLVAGHSMVAALHEAADMGPGGWQLFTGAFEALKPLVVTVDTVFEMVKILGHDPEISLYAIEQQEAFKKQAAQFLACGVYAQLENAEKAAIKHTDLYASFLEVLKDVDVRDTNALEKIKSDGAFLTAFNKNNPNLAAATTTNLTAVLNAKTPEIQNDNRLIITEIKEYLKITDTPPPSPAQYLHLQAFTAKALELLSANDQLTTKQIVAAVALSLGALPAAPSEAEKNNAKTNYEKDFIAVFNLLRNTEWGKSELSTMQVLEKLYPEQAKNYSHGLTDDEKKGALHQIEKQKYLAQLFTQELMQDKSERTEQWIKIAENEGYKKIVAELSGQSFQTLRDHPVERKQSTHKRLKEIAGKTIVGAILPIPQSRIESPADIAKHFAISTAEGLGRMGNLLGRLPMKIIGTLGQPIMRDIVSRAFSLLPGKELNLIESNFMSLGYSIANFLSGNLAALTIARPDDVSGFRRTNTEAVLTKPTPDSELPVGMKTEELLGGLSDIVNVYKNAVSATSEPPLIHALHIALVENYSEVAWAKLIRQNFTGENAADLRKNLLGDMSEAEAKKMADKIQQRQKNPQLALASILCGMFPEEAKNLINLMGKTGGYTEAEQAAYLTASLQKVFCDELAEIRNVSGNEKEMGVFAGEVKGDITRYSRDYMTPGREKALEAEDAKKRTPTAESVRVEGIPAANTTATSDQRNNENLVFDPETAFTQMLNANAQELSEAEPARPYAAFKAGIITPIRTNQPAAPADESKKSTEALPVSNFSAVDTVTHAWFDKITETKSANPRVVGALTGNQFDFKSLRLNTSTENEKATRVAAAALEKELKLTGELLKFKTQASFSTSDYRFSKDAKITNELVKEAFFAANKSEQPASKIDVAEAKNQLAAVIGQYKDTKSKMRGPRFDSYLIKRLREAVNTFPERTTAEAAALHVLKILFPNETGQIAALLNNAKIIKPETRDATMLHALQKVFETEFTAAKAKSTTARAAFEAVFTNNNSGFFKLLSGGAEPSAHELKDEKMGKLFAQQENMCRFFRSPKHTVSAVLEEKKIMDMVLNANANANADATTVSLSNKDIIKSLENVVEHYVDNKSSTSMFVSPLFQGVMKSLEDFAPIKIADMTTLTYPSRIILMNLFPKKLTEIEECLGKLTSTPSDTEKARITLDVLQQVFKQELSKASTDSPTAHAAFIAIFDQPDTEQVRYSDLRKLLSGDATKFSEQFNLFSKNDAGPKPM
ncbi:MAG: hypothetical protein NTZ67_02160 [Gammaproteobacteria bacterium]|nr:hypothetical protein [Gammaproteobacteria bacterium]